MTSREDRIKCEVENMPKFHQVEVLRLLKSEGTVVLNENKNGVFVNLSQLPEAILVKLENYVVYVGEQQSCLEKQETARVSIAERFFKGNKEIGNVKISSA